jgi:ABC-type arginine transport system ATPase subunit
MWGEAKDKLNQSGMALSGGQQQRLCIARAVSVRPRFCCSTSRRRRSIPFPQPKIEELITELKQDYTIAIVTHNMQAGSAGVGFHGLHVSRRVDRVRCDGQSFPQAEAAGDRGLHYGQVWLS